MRRIIITVALLPSLILASAGGASAQDARAVAFTNGLWFDGSEFQAKTAYVVGDTLSFRRPKRIDETIDLHGGFVVPPFGEAHNHNVESLNKIDELIARYLQHGIFYVKNPNSLARDRPVLAPKLNRPQSIDVVFSNGSFTGSGGHPQEIPERVIKRGLWTAADAEGGFYFTVDSREEFERKWPVQLATGPDFIKTYLLYSEEYAKRKNDPKYLYWRGLDPALLPLIVEKAHAAGLRVSTHIESAADFHNALLAGVDEINHMPGFRSLADVERHPPSAFEISDADARLAARRGTFVVTTLVNQQSDPNLQRQQDAINAKNLSTLLKYHVKVALGSDSYRIDTVPEALYLHSLNVVDNRTLLKMWCETTAETIFPRRKIGRLKEGYEASFLVLESDPLKDFEAVQRIRLRVKQGRILRL
jgi:hypothetical protein